MSGIKDLQHFPAIFTFKIVGNSGDEFKNAMRDLFNLSGKEFHIKEKESSGGKYTSFSVTTLITDYEELEKIYKEISLLNGLRFYV